MKKLLLCLVLAGCSGYEYESYRVPVPGPAGKDGEGCIATPVPEGVLLQCGTGEPQLIKNGSTGSKGDTGNTGAPGSPGQDSTPVIMVKFCPQAASYPTVFPEYGICVGNKLYGVYSIPNAFLAYLPEGNYSSSAVGSSCSFKITNGCEIDLL